MSDEKMTILTRAHLPDALGQAWLQHLRDFDTTHPECHFEVMVEDSGIPLHEAVKVLMIDPGLKFMNVVLRKQT